MEINYILSLITVIIVIGAMGFLVGTPLMRKYYSQKLQAEKQGDLIKGQLSLKIRNLKNKLKQKKKK